MTAPASPHSFLEAEYLRRTPASARLFREALEVFPSGVTHDSRVTFPYPPCIVRAAGARKWDADGNEYVDYFGGHGALLLGHCHPSMVEAVSRQLHLGTHPGASHESELRWGQRVQRLVPCAERVRFTASGTEASHLALRLARAYTGRPKILRFAGHFHGWHDQVTVGALSHYDGSAPVGILPALAEQAVVLQAGDVERVVATLEERDDIAAVILEPSGASWGQVPLPPALMPALREVTRRRGVVLIFDEVITGFRWSRGGAQAHFGITPDLCLLAKILAGGLPGGAIAGRREILDALDASASRAAGREKVGHQGTFNANPLSAAAGIAMLDIVEREDVCERACATAAALRDGLRRIVIEEDVPWGIYGERSTFIVFVNPAGRPLDPATFDPLELGFDGLKGAPDPGIAARLRLAMLAHGVDLIGAPGGVVSAVHTEEDSARTFEAFRASLRAMKSDGSLARPRAAAVP